MRGLRLVVERRSIAVLSRDRSGAALRMNADAPLSNAQVMTARRKDPRDRARGSSGDHSRRCPSACAGERFEDKPGATHESWSQSRPRWPSNHAAAVLDNGALGTASGCARLRRCGLQRRGHRRQRDRLRRELPLGFTPISKPPRSNLPAIKQKLAALKADADE